jgi:uncharacterized repeat protein (TIGR01451 family)/fimbrial isopeptide formation D2 family protein
MALAAAAVWGCLMSAGRAADGLRVVVVAAYNLVVDSNVESPSSFSPRSAFLGAKFYNDGATDLTNVFAYIGDYRGGMGDTPGLYPTNRHPAYPTIVGPLAGGYFSLTHEGGQAGRADATRYIGTIPAGGCVVAYWLISYPLKDVNGKAVWGPSVKPSDDLTLDYDIWITGLREGTPVTADVTRRLTLRNEISAMANKIYPNSANKVPAEYMQLLDKYAPSWTNEYQDGSPGTRVVTEGVWYDLGNVGAGFDNNGDLVPDRNAWLQPVGDPSSFDASAYRLVRTHALVVVKRRDGTVKEYMVDDQLYFENIPEDNVGAVGYVKYEFLTLRAGGFSRLSPYQEVASGMDNEKFNGDYGATLGGFQSPGTSQVILAKSSSPAAVGPGSDILYELAFTNAGSLAVGDPAVGLPLVVQDAIPAGVRYVAGSATNANLLPAGAAGYTVLFSTNGGSAWLTAEPADAAAVTHIQWWLQGPLAVGAAGAVRFSATVCTPFLEPAPRVVNTGGLSFGNGAAFVQAMTTNLVAGTNRLGDRVFRDDGAGGGAFGNGSQEGGETGIPDVTVRLYLDLNTNGALDSADALFGSASTGPDGSYLFTNLFDGFYLAAVDLSDPDLPFGYASTTSMVYAVDLDAAQATEAMVVFTNADFGFAPAIVFGKTRLGGASVYEGSNVTFALSVANRLPGNGGAYDTWDLWATNLNPNSFYTAASAWSAVTNAYRPSYPDTNYSFCVPQGGADMIGLDGYSLTNPPNAAITKLELLILTTVSGSWLDDQVTFRWFTNANGSTPAVYTNLMPIASLPPGTNYFTLDVTDRAAGLGWSTFARGKSNVVQISCAKLTGPDGGSFGVDQAGFRITTDQVAGDDNPAAILNPVPLVDTFDVERLQYVGASLTPASVTTNGSVGTIRWSNIGPVYPGGTNAVTVTFKALAPAGGAASNAVTNVAAVTGAFFENGLPVAGQTSSASVVVLRAGAIGDRLWWDVNANGVQDEGEAGIAGASVRLTSTNLTARTNVTDQNGWFLFDALPSNGTYTVSVLTNTFAGGLAITNTYDEDGNRNHTNVVVLSDYAEHLTSDFGYRYVAFNNLIQGTVWNDLDRDGGPIPGGSEPWLTNVTVYLYANGTATGTPVATNRTSSSGSFSFFGNYTGAYSVRVVTNSGTMTNLNWAGSYDTDGVGLSPNFVAFTLAAGETRRADFSYYQTGAFTIGDTLFYDWSGDGLQGTNEPGIPNVRLLLYLDVNTNRSLNTGVDVPVGVVTTAVDGTYAFTARPPGWYLVVVDGSDTNLPDGYRITGDPYAAKDGMGALTLTNASNLAQDFGFQPYGSGAIGDRVWYDRNGNGLQDGGAESGLAGIEVALWADLTGSGTYAAVTNARTDVSGFYLFEHLPVGAFRVTVSASDTNLPADVFGSRYVPTTPLTNAIVLGEGDRVLTADFGFAALGAVGDTVFWDANRNGSQDVTEGGVSGAVVNLYLDVNTNRLVDIGTDPWVAGQVTDTNGHYLFTGLAPGSYVVAVAQTGVLLTASISIDPDSDGIPEGQPGASGNDGQYGLRILAGTAFMGADFGYVPAGVIGDCLWLDTNGDGVRDANESGIPYVTVELLTGGVVVASLETDADGMYLFAPLPDGSYTVRVQTNDADFPAGLGLVYDPDGTPDSRADPVVISGGVVVLIGTHVHANGSLAVDFGYRFTGNNALSGTVGLDASPYDGVLGSGASGVGPGEAPFAGGTLYLYLWNDDGDITVEAGETRLISSTQTAVNGDYAFENLPAGDGNDLYIVALAAPAASLKLTTFVGATPATMISETADAQGNTVSAFQVVPIAPAITNMDFAFRSLLDFDYGDLPESYGTRLENLPDGPRHVVRSTTNLYLGLGIDAEPNGQPTTDASGDGVDEDGVVPIGSWVVGTTGGVVQVRVGKGSGWLTGYMDFNRDGDFADPGELILNQAVSATGGDGGGLYSLRFNVPAGGIVPTNTTVIRARFRLSPSAPAFPSLAFAGQVEDGEVEDYQWLFGSLGSLVWIDQNQDGIKTPSEPVLAGVRVFLDLNGDGIYQENEPSAITGPDGRYGIGGLEAGSYTVAVDTNTVAGLLPVYDLDGVGTAHRAAAPLATNGHVRVDVNFGYLGTASLGDTTWVDANTNGIQDGGEAGLAGVTVSLCDAASNLLATAVSSAGGAYVFSNLPAGSYRLRFAAPGGYAITLRGQGGAAEDSDPDPVTGYTDLYTLGDGETVVTADAGFVPVPVTAEYLLGKSVISPTNGLVLVGQAVAYALTVTNSGTTGLDPVRLDDWYDTNVFLFVSATPPANATNEGGVAWTSLGPLLPGASVTVTARFEAIRSVGLGGEATNLAVATVATTNGVPLAGQTSAVPIGVLEGGYRLLKSVMVPDGQAAVPGAEVVFAITAVNTGEVGLAGVRLEDRFNTNHLTFISSVPAPNASGVGSLTWTNVGPLEPGDSVTVTARFTAVRSLWPNGYATNRAVALNVTVTNGMPLPGWTSAAPVAVVEPRISLEKSVSSRGEVPGESFVQGTNGMPLLFTFVVSNGVEAALTNVILTDPLLGVTTNLGDLAVGQVRTVTVASVISGDRTNTAAVVGQYPGGGSYTNTDDAVVDQIVPALTLSKTVSGTGAVPGVELVQGAEGQPVTYSFVVRNTGDVALTNVSLADTLIAPSLATNLGTLAAGQALTVTAVRAIAGDLTNMATVAGYDPLGVPWTAADTAVVDQISWAMTLAKRIVGTSETNRPPDSTNVWVQIGEIVTYELEAHLPESTLTNLAFTDRLPDGMAYVVGSLAVDTFDFDGTIAAATQVTPNTGVLGGDGEDVSVTFLGTIAVSENGNPTGDVLRLRFDAVVLNTNGVSGLAPATILTNSASVTFVGYPLDPATTPGVVVTVQEPQVFLLKQVSTNQADAGDPVTVTLRLTNSGTAAAYNVEVVDVLDPRYLDPDTVTTSSVPAGYVLVASNGAVYGRSDPAAPPGTNALEPGETVAFVFQVLAAQALAPNATFTNRAVLRTDSLGRTNVAAQQRFYGATSAVTLASANLALTKTLVASSEQGPADSTNAFAQIGEVFTFELAAHLPEGTISNLVYTDRLPAGLAYVAGSAEVVTNGFHGTVAPATNVTPSTVSLGGSGEDVIVTLLGHTVVAADNDPGNNTLRVRFQAIALDTNLLSGLPPQTVLTNTAELTFAANPSNPVLSGEVLLTVIEPHLGLAKTLTPAAGDAGDWVTATLVLTNSGTGTAYDLAVTDQVWGAFFDIATISNLTPMPGWLFEVVTNAPDARVRYASDPATGAPTNTLEAGESLAFAFRARLAQAVTPGLVVTNTARVAAADTIRHTNVFGIARDKSGAWSGDSLTVSNLQIAKVLAGTSETGPADTSGSDVTIGERAIYRLTVTLPECTVSNLVITDATPTGLAYVSGSVSVEPGFGGSLPPGSPVVTGGGNGEALTLSFPGHVVVSNDNNPANNQLRLLLSMRVLDVPVNDGVPLSAGGGGPVVRTNAATVAFAGQPPVHTSGVVTVRVVEPALDLWKTMSPPSNNWVEVGLAVSNKGLSAAFDLDLADFFPTSTWATATLSAVEVPTGFVWAVTDLGTGALLRVSSDPAFPPPTNSVATGQVIRFRFQVQLQPDVAGMVTNVVALTNITTLAGPSPFERKELELAATNVLGLVPGVAIRKTLVLPSGREAEVGETVTFAILVTNTGPVGLSEVRVEDVYPTNELAFLAAVPAANAVGAGWVAWTNVGPLEPYMATSLSLSFTALAGTWPGSATNVATVRAVATNGLPLPPKTNEAPVSILAPSFGLLKERLSPQGRPADLGELVLFRIGVTNTGDSTLAALRLEDGYDTNILAFSAGTPGYTNSPGFVAWTNLGPVAPGAYVAVTAAWVTLAGTLPGQTTNRAVARAATAFGLDLPPLTSAAPVRVAVPGYTLHKDLVRPVGRPAVVGETMTFRLAVSNSGPVTLGPLAVQDAFPTNRLLFLSSAPPAAAVEPGQGSIAWSNLGYLAASGVCVITARFEALSVTAPGWDTNAAIVTGLTTTNGTPVPGATNPAPFQVDPPSALGGVVWADLDETVGIRGYAEPILTNILVGLYDAASSSFAGPQTGVASMPLANLRTDADGRYLFTGLPAGSYRVRFQSPANFVYTRPHVGSDPSVDSDALADGWTAPLALAAGETNITLDAGLFEGASLYGLAWNDVNANGIREAGEPLVAGAVFTLLTNGQPLATWTTTVDGAYSFVNLRPGAYAVHGRPPAGYVVSPKHAGDPVVDSDFHPGTMLADPRMLDFGGIATNVDLGLYRPAADLRIEKVASAATVSLGGQVVFTITITNQGPNRATALIVRDLLPAGMGYVGHAGGLYSPADGRWVIGELGPGAVTSLWITATVTNLGCMTNRAEIAESAAPDPDSTDNQAWAEVCARDDNCLTTLAIRVIPQHGRWTLQGPPGYEGPTAGLGDFGPIVAPTGTYVISYHRLPPYRTPSVETRDVRECDEAVLTGRYIRLCCIQDYDGDGATDLALYHEATGSWYVLNPLTGAVLVWALPWGGPGMIPVRGDFDGDGLAEISVYMPAPDPYSRGMWYVRRPDGTVLAFDLEWGCYGYEPVAGDFDGDGACDIGVYNRASGQWYVRNLAGDYLIWGHAWGGPRFSPVRADFSGDGAVDLAAFERATAAWYAGTREGDIVFWNKPWGAPNWTPVAADYDGNDFWDLAVYDPLNGRWYIQDPSCDCVLAWDVAWGGAGYTPVMGDYDGDGRYDLAVYEEDTGLWYIQTLDGRILFWGVPWGGPGYRPIP